MFRNRWLRPPVFLLVRQAILRNPRRVATSETSEAKGWISSPQGEHG
jgi:hypothetical protein